MAKVSKLMGDAPAAPARPAGKNGSTAVALKEADVPEWLRPTMLAEQAEAEIPSGAFVPSYVGFASERSNNWDNLSAAGLAEGDPFVSVRGEVVKCAPLKFMLFDAMYCKAKFDDRYQLMQASMDFSDRDMDDYVLGLAVVFLPDGRLVPAKADFTGTKSAIGAEVYREIRRAAEPEWATRSEGHKLAASIGIVPARVTGSAYTVRRAARSSGRVYYQGKVNVSPTRAEDLIALGKALKDKDFVDLGEEVRASMEPRRLQLQELLAA